MSWGRGFYNDGGSAVEQVLAQIAQQAQRDEEIQRQEAMQRAEMEQRANLNNRDVTARILAAYMANPNEQTYAAAKASGLLGDMGLPEYKPTDQEIVQRNFYGGVRSSLETNPGAPLQVDPVHAGLANPALASAAPWMGIASQRYNYGKKDALPPEVMSAQRVDDKLDMNADEREKSRQWGEEFTKIKLPESAWNIKLTGAQVGQANASAGESRARTGLIGAQTENEREKPTTPGGRENFKDERYLRQEYLKEVKNYPEIQDSLSRIRAAAADSSGASDVALLFSFMKLNDPGSVVRESEQALILGAQGWADRTEALVKSVRSGDKLSPAQRKTLENVAEQLVKAVAPRYEQVKQRYGTLAQQYQLDPANVIGGAASGDGVIEYGPDGRRIR